MSQGWISIHRKLMQWGWYHDSQVVHLFIHLLLRANHADGEWLGTPIKRGQLITGRKKLSNETGISEQSIRTCLTKLKSTNEITIKSTNKNSLITIVNYETYQIGKNESTNESTSKLTNDQPTTNQQLTTNNNKNKKNKNKEDILTLFKEQNKKRFYDHVYLTNEEHEGLLAFYGDKRLTPSDLDYAIRALDSWFEDNPKMRQKRTCDAKALKGWPLEKALVARKEFLQLQKQEEFNARN